MFSLVTASRGLPVFLSRILLNTIGGSLVSIFITKSSALRSLATSASSPRPLASPSPSSLISAASRAYAEHLPPPTSQHSHTSLTSPEQDDSAPDRAAPTPSRRRPPTHRSVSLKSPPRAYVPSSTRAAVVHRMRTSQERRVARTRDRIALARGRGRDTPALRQRAQTSLSRARGRERHASAVVDATRESTLSSTAKIVVVTT
eukprot:CAMPEP_0179704180 /NCGR_PEP_ID=MMETSP0937-20121108/3187_1 /TAXON_ID=548131 ORGANISM="Ostreococcus mediterraneus, Strain clade-D-RCC2593" /NCGR_SAMPLE_ID=MMETSP0937 /ASSEMBLY_ACC=CAM_ASM_000575 /LENGTH=202 /DNA_ID=CAMNT_0021577391 /DNA_START=138 /DNA_END=745 /DNA_ORIENTATION=+